MFIEKFHEARNLALEQAVENFKTTKRGSYKVLKLIKENIQELVDSGLNMPEQVQIINSALDIKIAYSTYKAFYYSHMNKRAKQKQSFNNSPVIKKESSTIENKKELDIFADLKG